MATEVQVTRLPDCDFCRLNDLVLVPATYDAKTVHGLWANMCEQHYRLFAATTKLGTGLGQRLVLITPPTQ